MQTPPTLCEDGNAPGKLWQAAFALCRGFVTTMHPDYRVAAQWTTANMTWQNTVVRICNTLHVIVAHVGPPSLRITSSLSEPSHETLQKKLRPPRRRHVCLIRPIYLLGSYPYSPKPPNLEPGRP
jgi:alpha-galactosidase